jgi:hypothetical protein
MNMTAPKRPTMLRSLAERVAAHPHMQQALLSAMTSSLPYCLTQVVADEAKRRGEYHLKVTGSRIQPEDRQIRDQRLRGLLAAGTSACAAAADVGCSVRHAQRVQTTMRRAKPGP